MNLFISLICLLLLIPIGIGLWFSLRLFLTNQDRASFNILLIVICFDIWNVSRLLLILGLPDSLFPYPFMSGIARIGTISIILGVVGIFRALDKPLYGKHIRFFTLSGMGTFFVQLGLAISDLFLSESLFYRIEFVKEIWIMVFHPLVSFLTLLGTSLLLGAIFFSLRRINLLPDFISFRDRHNWAFILFVLFSMILFAGLIFSAMTIYLGVPWLFSLCLIMLITGAVLITFHSAQDLPFLLLGGMMQPKILLKQGYIGYFLSTWSNQGPTPLICSSKFIEFTSLSESALLNLGVRTVSTLGMEHRHIALVPVPENPDLLALALTFPYRNSELLDPDLRNHAPSMFAILFPSILTVALNQINRALPIILDYIYKKTDIQELADHQYLAEITVNVFHTLQN